jgi:hypothetical protein
MNGDLFIPEAPAQPFRIEPKMPSGAYRTYLIERPRDTMVRAACEQVDCKAWRNGWETFVDESTDLGRAQAEYIRTRSRRTFQEGKTGAGLTVFTFEKGQRCFVDHETRPEVYGVVNGDHRQAFGTVRTHVRASDWVEDFGEHQQDLAEQIERG